MKRNTLRKVYEALRDGKPEVTVDAEIAEKALRPIVRMLEMSE